MVGGHRQRAAVAGARRLPGSRSLGVHGRRGGFRISASQPQPRKGTPDLCTGRSRPTTESRCSMPRLA